MDFSKLIALTFLVLIFYIPLRYLFIYKLIGICKIFGKNNYFKLLMYFAKQGHYQYEGSMCMAETHGFPVARVQYEDGVSNKMAIGTAVEYAKMFKGTVIPA